MKFVEKVRLLFSNNFDEMVQKFLIGEDVVNIPAGHGSMNTTSAMKYTAVFACLRVLAETHATVPVQLYRKKDDGDREARNDLAVYDILHNRPNEEMSPFNFKESCMMALNTGGNAVCERLVNRRGELVGLYPYQWQQVKIDRNLETKKLQYKISDGIEKITKTLSREQVFHVPFTTTRHSEQSLALAMNPMLSAAYQTLTSKDDDADSATEEFIKKWLPTGPIPNNIMKAQRLTRDDIPEIYKDSKFKYFFGLKGTEE